MIPAREPIHRPADAKLLFVRRSGALEHRLRRDFVRLLRTGDLVIANDAATLPASLTGIHVPSGRAVEVRLAARSSLNDSIAAGPGLARLKLGPETRLRVVDAILSGTHENGTSHHELLRTFVPGQVLSRMDEQLEACGYRTHEFGDSVLIEAQPQ